MLTRLALGSILATGLIVFTACSSSDSGPGTASDAGSAETSTAIDSGGGGGGNVATGGACDGTESGAGTCVGQLCLSLNPNKQNKDGICTEPCSASQPCSDGTSCVDFESLGTLCLKDCLTDAQCSDGFICLDAGASDGTKFCFVEVNEPADGGTDAGGDAGGDYCKAQDCDIMADPKGYCDNNAAAKRVCDCPSGKTPNAACTAATTGANLWCCPAAP